MLLIKDHMMLREEHPHLGHEIPLAVTFFLRTDLPNQRTPIGRADRKRTVPSLPRKLAHAVFFRPSRRVRLQLRDHLSKSLGSVQPHRQVHMVRHSPDPKAVALPVPQNRRRTGVQSISEGRVNQRPATSRIEHEMNRNEAQRLGHGRHYESCIQPSLLRRLRNLTLAPQAGISRAFSASILGLSLLPGTGCKSSKPAPTTIAAASPYPPRPTTASADFTVFHQDNNTYILVTKPTTTDRELGALIWQLRDAAQAHTFDALHLSQQFIDARHPKIFFHLYRGAKCASETYGKLPYPCGASYHGSGDFSVGGFSNPSATDGSLVAPDGAVTHLWNADAK